MPQCVTDRYFVQSSQFTTMNPFINCLSIAAVYLKIRNKKKCQKRRYHVHPIVAQRTLSGEFTTLFSELREHDDKFFNYFKLSIKSFDELLVKLDDHLKHCNLYRDTITPIERLAVTLRYLTSGHSYIDLHYNYRLGASTVGAVVVEVCIAIWNILRSECLPFPSSQEGWQTIADEFYKNANFPNCIGAIDGKHVRIICPAHSGSSYNNYKKYFSIVLLAMCDSNYCYTYINVGSMGTDSDSTIFRESHLYTKLQNNQINLPPPRLLPNTNREALPFVVVGDAAFGISNHVLRPCARSNMTYKKKIFNYRLSRARRFIESTFGIMSNKFRIFHTPMRTSVANTIKIVKACCVLHNYIRIRDGYNYEDTLTVVGLEQNEYNRNEVGRSGDFVREKFATYFISPEGRVPWQDRHIF